MWNGLLKKKWLRNLLVALVLLVLFFTLAVRTVQPRENLTLIEKGLRIAASPFQYGFKGINDSVSGFFSYFTEKEALQQENDAMKKEISQYETWGAHAFNDLRLLSTTWSSQFSTCNDIN